MNFSQSEIFKCATPAQKILWNHVFLEYGDNVAISQYYYQGILSANTMLVTFSSNRMFVAYSFLFNQTRGTNSGYDNMFFYDDANVQSFTAVNGTSFWQATAATWAIGNAPINIENILFSRVSHAQPGNYVKFIGFIIGK